MLRKVSLSLSLSLFLFPLLLSYLSLSPSLSFPYCSLISLSLSLSFPYCSLISLLSLSCRSHFSGPKMAFSSSHRENGQFEAKNTVTKGKSQKDKWYPLHACTPPPCASDSPIPLPRAEKHRRIHPKHPPSSQTQRQTVEKGQGWTDHGNRKSSKFANFVGEPGFNLNSPKLSSQKPPTSGGKKGLVNLFVLDVVFCCVCGSNPEKGC